MWSPLDPDFIITGSADSTVRIWRVAYNLPQKKVYKKLPKKPKKKQNETNKIVDTIESGLLELTNATSECSISGISQTVQSTAIILIKVIKKYVIIIQITNIYQFFQSQRQ